MELKTTGGPAAGVSGLWPERKIVRCTKRGGAGTKGDIVMFDLLLADAGTVDNDLGESDSGMSTVIEPTAAAADRGNCICGVLMNDVADDAEVDVCVYGVVDLFVHAQSAIDVDAGTYLHIDVADEANALTNVTVLVSEKTKRFWAIALTTTTTPTTPTLASCWFDGLRGVGTTSECIS